MTDLPRSQVVAYAIAFTLIALLGARQLARDGGGGEAAARTAPAPISVDDAAVGGGRVVVHVAGAVRRPGVYSLRAGARVDDAVRRAGGARARADLSALNLAAELQDGRQVLVPRRTPSASPGTAATGGATGPVSLSTATLEQLDALAGIGPATAQKIIDFRTEHGGFASVDQLGEIAGIGEKRLAGLREQVAP